MINVLIYILAGIGAGLGTGFAGMSAATIISPMLIIFVGMDAYKAIGIALISDVLASAVSAYTYGKNKNIDLKNGILMMISVLLATLLGSYLSSFANGNVIGNVTVYATVILGLKFIIKPVMTTKNQMNKIDNKTKKIKSILGGILIGLICGYIGAGGGIMMLLIFTTVLGYELKTAVGTSVFIMTFIALTGGISHFVIGGIPDILCLVICSITTLIFAKIASSIANRVNPKLLNRLMGSVLLIIGIVMIIFNNMK